MFESRLKAALVLCGLMVLVLIGRLVDLQIVRADHFRRQTERSLLRQPKSLPFARGAILDRHGEILVNDVPSWDLRVDFEILAVEFSNDRDRLLRAARRFQRAGVLPRDIDADVAADRLLSLIHAGWLKMAGVAGHPSNDQGNTVRAQAKEIHDRIVEIRRLVARRRGFDAPVAEETAAHAVISGLDREAQITARERLAEFPWISIEASTRRSFMADATPFAHVLGRTGRITAEQIASDPNPDDPFARYVPQDIVGFSGVEAAAEPILRGRRGRVTLDRSGQVTDDFVEPQTGGDVFLTLHADLQRRLYRLLEERIRSIPDASGGAVVVLDVPSREALALVSYPSYDPAEWDEQYPWLRDDTDRLPLSFRAVANRYAPGSIVKPLVCLAGLVNRRITLDTREDCLGYLDPQHPDRRRCWEIHGTNLRKAHGSIDVVEALTGSCNVFLFRVGERLGVDALCSAFDMAGLGRSTGIGLREENPGINPTPDWLMKEKGTEVYPAHAWNFSIGQGELAVTPIQAANLAAIYASGRFRHVSLWRPQASRPEWVLPGTAEQWSAIRRGIFGVVNDPSGTAHDFARFEHERYCLMGKTGSATAHPWPTAYRIPYVDATGQQGTTILRAGAKGPACKRFEVEFPGATYDPDQVSVSATWPREVARDSNYSHAWFAGYLQAVNGQGQPEEWQAPRVAFAVLVEFGGSGGRTSGPLAREIADLLFEYLGPDLALR